MMPMYVAVICFLLAAAAPATPSDMQKHIDAVAKHADAQEWGKAEVEYNKINWAKVDKPIAAIRAMSDKLKNGVAAAKIRKELKTKYELLREKGDPDLSDTIAPIEIPIVEIQHLEFPAVQIPMFRAMLAMMRLWEQRFSQEQEYFTGSGRRLPAPGTALWGEREKARRSDIAGAWEKYNERLKNAIMREEKLRRR